MKKALGIALMSIVGSGAFAQESNWCGTDAHLEDLLRNNPEQKQVFEDLNRQVTEMAMNGITKRDGETIIIPTVVHVLYSDCEGSISRAQVLDGMRILNEDIQRKNADANQTREIFKSVAQGADIEFRLARIDPQGNATDGINRLQTFAAINAGNNVKNLTNWPANKYFNIWVVESISSSGGGTVLGYAQFPGTGSWNTYGIVIRNDAFGTIGTSTADGRTLPHEVGHCLDLYHTFQSGCGTNCSWSGDQVCDTPPSAEASWSCDVGINSCSNDAGGSSPFSSGTPDMIENFMSYNSCQNLFTEGQVARMYAALNVHSTLKSLTSQSNLESVGVAGLLAADFQTQREVVIAHRPMTFEDATLYNAEEWQWDFGASSFPATSSQQSPIVTMIETGLMPVSLTAKAGNSSVSTTKEVFVVTEEGRYLPYQESFDNVGSVPNEQWLTQNTDQDERELLVTAAASYDGENSVMIENGGCGEYSDQLITQTLDFSPFDEVRLTFKAAYAKRDNESNDYLRLLTSDDYGASWQINWIRSATNLSSVTGFKGGSWFPSNENEWKEHTVTFFQSSLMEEGILIKLEFVGKGGNNFFIDDIRFEGDFTGELLLKSPKNGKTGLTKDVTIDWKAVGEADFYEYQIDVVNTFTSESLITGTKDFIDNTPVNEDTEFEANDLEPGQSYYWRVRYDNGGTLSDWSPIWAFSVSEDGLGVSDELNSESVLVYPNPTESNVTIESEGTKIQSISLFDLSGRKVLERPNAYSNRVLINVEQLNSGLYMLQIVKEDGTQGVESLMIR